LRRKKGLSTPPQKGEKREKEKGGLELVCKSLYYIQIGGDQATERGEKTGKGGTGPFRFFSNWRQGGGREEENDVGGSGDGSRLSGIANGATMGKKDILRGGKKRLLPHLTNRSGRQEKKEKKKGGANSFVHGGKKKNVSTAAFVFHTGLRRLERGGGGDISYISNLLGGGKERGREGRTASAGKKFGTGGVASLCFR